MKHTGRRDAHLVLVFPVDLAECDEKDGGETMTALRGSCCVEGHAQSVALEGRTRPAGLRPLRAAGHPTRERPDESARGLEVGVNGLDAVPLSLAQLGVAGEISQD